MAKDSWTRDHNDDDSWWVMADDAWSWWMTCLTCLTNQPQHQPTNQIINIHFHQLQHQAFTTIHPHESHHLTTLTITLHHIRGTAMERPQWCALILFCSSAEPPLWRPSRARQLPLGPMTWGPEWDARWSRRLVKAPGEGLVKGWFIVKMDENSWFMMNGSG